MTNKSFEEGVQFAWDATSITLARTCMRKYKYKMLDGWQPRRTSVHLIFGALYATALEHYHLHIATGDSHDDAQIKVVHEALINTWNIEGQTGGWVSDHNAKTRSTLIRTIVWYLEEFIDDPAKTVILSNGKPAVELSFTLPVNDDIVFCGHLDKVVDLNDSNFVMDQKTTGSTVSTKFFDQFSPHDQFSMYSYAGQIILSAPIAGVIIDAAQIAVGFSRFERGFTFRNPGLLDEWMDDTLHLIDYARQLTSDEYFPLNPAACGNYGGCEFRGVCSRAPSVREQFLKADFTQGPSWDPIDRR